jgi:hypothetical protein
VHIPNNAADATAILVPEPIALDMTNSSVCAAEGETENRQTALPLMPLASCEVLNGQHIRT